MPMLLSSALFVLVILGFAKGFSRKMPLSLGLFNAVAFLGVLMFLSFLFHMPQGVAWGLLVVGLGMLWGGTFQDRKTLIGYVLLGVVIFGFDMGLRFRSIDDYAYWGTISRYLFTFHALPEDAAYIGPSYLTYTPGLAAFHYLLYTLAGQYRVFLGYFAQGLVALSAIMVFFDEKQQLASMVRMGVIFIVLTFAFGTVLARMEADAYVALYFLAITWLIYTKGREAAPFIVIPLLFLSLIKEVGLFFALISLVMLLCIEKSSYRFVIGMLIGLLGLKGLWGWHTAHYHFQSFAHQMNWHVIVQALNVWDPHYHLVQWLYLKGIFLLRFDNILHLPYIVLYLIIAAGSYGVLRFYPQEKRLLMVWALAGVIYLLMLYLLQAIVFDVGYTNPGLLGFERYYNMFFFPFLMSCVLMIWTRQAPPFLRVLTYPKVYLIVGAAFLVLIMGKVGRSYRYYQSPAYVALYDQVIKKSQALSHSNWSVCLLNIKAPAYVTVLPLTYRLMPHRVYAVNEVNHIACDIVVE